MPSGEMQKWWQSGTHIQLEDDANATPINPLKEEFTTYSMSAPIKAVFSFKGTILPLVLARAEPWIFMTAHVGLIVANDVLGVINIDSFMGVEPWKVIGVPAGLLSFFIVFYTGQCLQRYSERRHSARRARAKRRRQLLLFLHSNPTPLTPFAVRAAVNTADRCARACLRAAVTCYASCTAISANMQVIMAQSSVHLSDHPTDRWDASRYLLSASMLVYMRVTDADAPSIDESDWRRLMADEGVWSGRPVVLAGSEVECPGLLSEEEVEALKRWPGNPSTLLCTWAMHALKRGMADAGCGPPLLADMQHHCVALQRAMGAIVNTLAMPVPFPYFHVLNLLMFLCYTMFALVFVKMHSPL